MSTPTESKKHKTLPHEPGFKWVFFDFNEHYDERLLRRFYNDLMIPNFPIQDGELSFHYTFRIFDARSY
jgi:hypothetical protein